jgi:hypothetical protein
MLDGKDCAIHRELGIEFKPKGCSEYDCGNISRDK